MATRQRTTAGRRTRVLGTALIAAMIAAGCGTKDLDATLSLKPPPIAGHEVCRYRILSPAGPAGSYVTDVRTDQQNGTPVYLLGLVTRTLAGNIETTDSSCLVLRQPDLRPLVTYRFVRTGGALVVTTAAKYGEEAVAVSTWTHTGQEFQKFLPTGPGFFDTDQLTFLGRALRPEPDQPVRVSVVEPMGPPAGGSVRAGEFRALGTEAVNVPAGRFDCRKLGLTIGETEIELWYERAGANRLVRYNSVATGISLELLPTEDQP